MTTAVLLHPHPAMGGNQFNHVIEALYRGLPSAYRFDFSSADPGIAAAETIAAIDACGSPEVALVGYSFGADIATTILDERVTRWVLIAPPLAVAAAIADDPRPKLLLVPAHDQFSPPARALARTADWVAAAVRTIPGADHFLMGSTDEVVAETLRALAE